ncbi:hypothetical protein BegalDRAFT_0838 [Beggiatoa alba B18LD]|uniref:Uncharacterized protein n=1 Tax=Beggiatoa alba B18LD TaxID=395493 RepID=I3CDQ5_9GAMM|nr:choice-of-anchor Q domain-containing protein [Beggiatoa alba]EIJ41748.1 hypothetical protein BegalDRAFT_0838 [Beggiatoa alba B18LD]
MHFHKTVISHWFYQSMLGLIVLCLSTLAQATTYTVTTLEDSGTGSLRQAILDANANPTDDEIVFAVNGIISLTSTLSINNNGSLTIIGNGAENTIISGSDTVRVFLVNAGTKAKITRLNITHGMTSLGAGIALSGQLILEDCIISNNTAEYGAGITAFYSDNSAPPIALTITRCLLTQNQSMNWGGAIMMLVNASPFDPAKITANIVDSTISENTSGEGGGIYSQSSTLTLTNTDVIHNIAKNGGGISTNGSIVKIEQSTIDKNQAIATPEQFKTTGQGSGGGISAVASTITLTNSSLNGNTASYGGAGAYLLNSQAIFSKVTINANTATRGGGLYFGSNKNQQLYITDSEIAHNAVIPFDVYTVLGGGITIEGGGLVIENTIISDNTTTNDGAGIGLSNTYGFGVTAKITRSQFIRNNANNMGGGLSANGLNKENGVSVAISDSIFNGNFAKTSGGGIGYGLSEKDFWIINSLFYNNSALSGGGVFHESKGTLHVINTTLTNNYAYYGGNLFINASVTGIGNTALINSIVANNLRGGDCYNHRGTITDGGTVSAQNSLIKDGLTCINGTNLNNLTGDPALNADFKPLLSSPVVDKGNNVLLTQYIADPKTDLGLNARIDGNAVDIGAYELQRITISPINTNCNLATATEISLLCNANDVEITKPLTVTATGNMSNLVISATVMNQGWLSNLYIKPTGTIVGGILTGKVTNRGTLTDIDFKGNLLEGGLLTGTIRNSSAVQGEINNVRLADNATLTGGILSGRIIGNPNAPAKISNVTIKAGSHLSGVVLGEGVTQTSNITIETAVTLPALPRVYAFDAIGEPTTTNSQFLGGISVGNTAHTTTATLNLSNPVKIKGRVWIDPAHIDKTAEFFVYAAYTHNENAEPKYYMLDKTGTIHLWNKEPTTLIPFTQNTLLETMHDITIYTGRFVATGKLDIVFGYRLADGTTVMNEEEMMQVMINP